MSCDMMAMVQWRGGMTGMCSSEASIGDYQSQADLLRELMQESVVDREEDFLGDLIARRLTWVVIRH
eukprot:758113-Hanusia_phi.AAC.2